MATKVSGRYPFYQRMVEITWQPLPLTLETPRLYFYFLFPFWKTEIDLGHHVILIITLLCIKPAFLHTRFFLMRLESIQISMMHRFYTSVIFFLLTFSEQLLHKISNIFLCHIFQQSELIILTFLLLLLVILSCPPVESCYEMPCVSILKYVSCLLN